MRPFNIFQVKKNFSQKFYMIWDQYYYQVFNYVYKKWKSI